MLRKSMADMRNFKGKHPDRIALWRKGEYDYAFGDDAIKVGAILGMPVETAIDRETGEEYKYLSFSCYFLDTYLPKLVKAAVNDAGGLNFKIAILE